MATQTIETDGYVPPRTPQQQVVALSTTATDLGNAITWLSHAGYDLWCAAEWLIGDESGQTRTVAASTAFFVPSGKLTGWYAKSASGTPNLVVTGARKVVQ